MVWRANFRMDIKMKRYYEQSIKYLEIIKNKVKYLLEIEQTGTRSFVEAVVKIFLILIIFMSICRIGFVLIDQFRSPISDLNIMGDSNITIDKNNLIFDKKISAKQYDMNYYVKYKNVDNHNLSFNMTRDEESFVYVVNLNNPKEPGQPYIPNLVANMAIMQDSNQPLSSISIHREFIVKSKFNFQNFYSNLSFNFIRNEIGMIMFLMILINIYSLVPYLIGFKDDRTEKRKFCSLILTSLILALILTLSPEGDIGEVRLNVSFESAISAFLTIISFILVYLFMEKNDFKWLIGKR